MLIYNGIIDIQKFLHVPHMIASGFAMTIAITMNIITDFTRDRRDFLQTKFANHDSSCTSQSNTESVGTYYVNFCTASEFKEHSILAEIYVLVVEQYTRNVTCELRELTMENTSTSQIHVKNKLHNTSLF